VSDLFQVVNGYLELPVTTDPDALTQAAFAAIAALFPGWVPNEGALEVAVIEQAMAQQAETATVASSMSQAAFAYYGSLVNIPQEQGATASVPTTWTMVDTQGYTIPAGTVVGFQVLGNQFVYFETTAPFTVPSGSSSLTDVVLTAQVAGSAGNGFAAQTMVPYTQLAFVSSVASTAVSAGGADPETTAAYLNRLSAELRLMATRPILPGDFAALAPNVTGIFRACAINGYSPGRTITDATLASSTALVDPGRSFATGGTTLNSTTLTDSGNSFTQNDVGRPLSGTGIATGAYAIELLSSGSVAMSAPATATGSGLTITLGGSFSLADVGRSVTGTGIPASTTITAYVSATQVTMNHAATATATNVTITLGALSGQPRCITVGACDVNGNAVSAAEQAALILYLQARREVNFLVFVIGPTQNEIDVTWQAIALSGYDAAAVQAAGDAALTAYLSAANWAGGLASPPFWNATQTTVRYLSVAGVLEAVPGIAYVTSLTIGPHGGSMGAVDLALSGVAPLAAVGTITGSVTGGS
jgi:hypothetical protein